MPNVVIIGAGEVGSYIAALLSKAEHNVIVVDIDSAKIEALSKEIDVATRVGSGTNWQLLEELSEFSPQYFIALTDSDETNLVACTIAKQLNYPVAIARLRDDRFLNTDRLDFARMFDADYFISPEWLCAGDILKKIESKEALLVENFSHGAIALRTLAIPKEWSKKEIPLAELAIPQGIIVALIVRNQGAPLFPHGSDFLHPLDEVTFIVDRDKIPALYEFLSLQEEKCESIAIFGVSRVGLNLAQMARKKGIEVTFIEKDSVKCRFLAESYPEARVLNEDFTDREFLRSERLFDLDYQVYCTESDECNIVGALLAKEMGAKEVSVTLANTNFVPLMQSYGLHHVFSPRVAALNALLPKLLRGKITSLVTLYENQAEVAEILVGPHSPLIGIPLSDLGGYLPNKFLIGMIQNRGRIMTAHGGRIISPGDTVTVIASPDHIANIEKYF